MIITVFGLGFVGLTTALGLAHMGHRVYGVDKNEARKRQLLGATVPFLEPQLESVLGEELGRRFFIASDLRQCMAESEVFFYCVGTPTGDEGQADLRCLLEALDETVSQIPRGKRRVLVVKSTVPPGTTGELVFHHLQNAGIRFGEDVLLANNPEFLREGHCWEDFIHADRIVIGTDMPEAGPVLTDLYQGFDCPVYVVSANTGEFIKYLSNSFLAAMISFSNEMAELADRIGGIEAGQAFQILHQDKRWLGGGIAAYAYPGCGYGGYCLPKDTRALCFAAGQRGMDTPILRNVIARNDQMPQYIARKIMETAKPGQTIGILGLSFKPESDDVRDSVPAKIIGALAAEGYCNLVAYDPAAMENFQAAYPFAIHFCKSGQEVANQADLLVILTAWEEFKAIKAHTTKPMLDFRYMGELSESWKQTNQLTYPS